MRRPAARGKADRNQPEIVRALEAIGARVQVLSAVGEGCPDLLIGWRGFNWLIEVKDGDAVPSAQKLTPAQVNWHRVWTGQVQVVRNVREALAVLGVAEAGRG